MTANGGTGSPEDASGDEVPWIALPAPGRPGDVRGVIAAYRHSRVVAALVRSRLPGHTVVPGVDGWGRPVVSVDGVRVVLTAPVRARRDPGAA